jgi:predicted transposase YdaD
MNIDDDFEESWFYQKILQKGVVEGMTKGMAKGMVEGMTKGMEQGVKQELQVLRKTLIRFIETHFPDQLSLARQQVELMTTPSQIQEILDELFIARTNDDVGKILLALPLQ